MEKLSRTKRYEDLRNSFSNDNEANATSPELDNYSNRLNSILYRPEDNRQYTQQTAPNQFYGQPQQTQNYGQPVQNNVPYGQSSQFVQQTPVVPQNAMPVEPDFSNYTIPSFESETQNRQSIDSILNNMGVNNVQANPEVAPQQFVNQTDSFVQPQQTPVAPQNAMPVEPDFSNYSVPSFESETHNRQSIDSILNNMGPNNDQTNQEPAPQQFVNQTDSFVQPQQTQSYGQSVQNIPNNVVGQPNSIDNGAQFNQPILNNQNNFVNQALNEAMNFNKNEGRETLDDIPKVLSQEVRNQNNANVLVDDQVSQDIQIQLQQAPQQQAVTQKLSEASEEMDDLLTIATIQANDDSTTLGTTIPFTIENNESKELDEEDEELDTPNKILNVLLSILVVALFAVLGFVIYELFKSGIIKFN